MNKENFKKLIQQFTDKPKSLCMAYHMAGCGTVGCISGWAGFHYAEENNARYDDLDLDLVASEWLDINYDDCEPLFYPKARSLWSEYCIELGVEVDYDDELDYFDIPPSVVIRILTELVEEKITLQDLA